MEFCFIGIITHVADFAKYLAHPRPGDAWPGVGNLPEIPAKPDEFWAARFRGSS